MRSSSDEWQRRCERCLLLSPALGGKGRLNGVGRGQMATSAPLPPSFKPPRRSWGGDPVRTIPTPSESCGNLNALQNINRHGAIHRGSPRAGRGRDMAGPAAQARSCQSCGLAERSSQSPTHGASPRQAEKSRRLAEASRLPTRPSPTPGIATAPPRTREPNSQAGEALCLETAGLPCFGEY